MSVKLEPSIWEESCDNCVHQEGRHYCLLHDEVMKNMDKERCDSMEKDEDEEGEA